MNLANALNAQVITASGSSAAVEIPPMEQVGAAQVAVNIDVTAASGTSPSITFSLEWSDDGSTWATPSPAQSFAALTAVSQVIEEFAVLGAFVRLAWTVSGTTPSFTVTAEMEA